MSKHSVTIGVDGSIRVDHHNDEAPEALQALSVAGGAQSVGAGLALPTSMSDLDEMKNEIHQLDAVKQAQFDKANKVFLAAHGELRDRQSRLDTATKVAQAMIHHGKTRGRNPDYIADKSHAIADALHARAGDLTQPNFDEILRQVIAEDTPAQEQ